MKEGIQVHYLEVVSLNVEQICTSYSKALGVSFSEPIAELGNAKLVTLENGVKLGIRAPMHGAEEATTRPYYLVPDIEKAVKEAELSGATVAVPPMEIPGHGRCAVLMYGSIQSGLWQV